MKSGGEMPVSGEWSIYPRPDGYTCISVRQEDGRGWTWIIPTENAQRFFRAGVKVTRGRGKIAGWVRRYTRELFFMSPR